MLRIFSLALVLNFFSVLAIAKDLGFRFTSGKCIDATGKSGLNPGYIGPCGDLSNVVISRFTFDDYDLSGAVFKDADLHDSSFRNVNLSNTSFRHANLRGVDLIGANLTDNDFTDADFSGNHLNGIKFVRAIFSQTSFTGADLSRADFSDARGENVMFRRAQLNGAIAARARLPRADLRGADMSGMVTSGADLSESLYDQRSVLPFSSEVATSRGLKFKKVAKLLVIWEKHVPVLNGLLEYLTAENTEVHLSAKPFKLFDGSESIADYSSILLLGTEDFTADMPESGQTAIVEFVQSGGTFMATQWIGYLVAKLGKLRKLREIVVFDYEKGVYQEAELTPVPEQALHPILEGISHELKYTAAFDLGHPHLFNDNPTTALLINNLGGEVVAFREFGRGRAVGFNFSGTYHDSQALGQTVVKRLILNTSSW